MATKYIVDLKKDEKAELIAKKLYPVREEY